MTKKIEKILFENADLKYRDFEAKLMPTVNIENIIGVRTPILRKLSKQLARENNIDLFLDDLPHKYYDENNLHGFIISECKDYEKAIKYVEALLPYIDNWATCDLLSPKAFKKHRDLLKTDINRWLSSDKPFTVRFGIEMIMSHFLDDDFDSEYLNTVAKIKSDDYYVNMMIAWYFATALAKQWDATLPFIENKILSPWVHNKTISKSNDSYRISDQNKALLKALRIKKEI